MEWPARTMNRRCTQMDADFKGLERNQLLTLQVRPAIDTTLALQAPEPGGPGVER